MGTASIISHSLSVLTKMHPALSVGSMYSEMIFKFLVYIYGRLASLLF